MKTVGGKIVRPPLPMQPNLSLFDGMRVLQAVMAADGPVGVRDLARHFGMDPTRTHRLLKTLAHLGFVYQNEQRQYYPGNAVHILAAQGLVASGLLHRALPVLREMREAYPTCVVALGVLWELSVSYLYHAEPGMPIEQGVGRLRYYPATQSSIGLMLLSHLCPNELNLRKQLALESGHRCKLPSQREFAKIQSQGYAVIADDVEVGTYSLAVPLGESAHTGLALSHVDAQRSASDVARELQSYAVRMIG